MKERIIQVEKGEKITVVLPTGERTVIFGPDDNAQQHLPLGRNKTVCDIQAQDHIEVVDDLSDFM